MDNITLINGIYQFTCQDVSASEGFDVPTTRDVFIDPPEREGSLFISEIAGKREMSWVGLLRTNIQANSQLLARVCYPGGLKTIQFERCDGTPVQIEATLKLINPLMRVPHPYRISAKAPNPAFLSQVLHSVQTGITTRKGGMPIPAAIPGPIGEGGGSPFVVNNAGDLFSRPKFTIKGPGQTFKIQNTSTGEIMIIDITLTASETAIIDTITNEATKGSQNIYGLITRTPVGEWIKLQPGNNNINFSATLGSSIATRLTIDYRDAYSGF